MDTVAQTQHVIEWFGMRSGVFLEPKKNLETHQRRKARYT